MNSKSSFMGDLVTKSHVFSRIRKTPETSKNTQRVAAAMGTREVCATIAIRCHQDIHVWISQC